MRKFITDPVLVPNNADLAAIQDAILSAKWREVFTREDLMEKTNLEGKCGSCKYFKRDGSKAYGYCGKGLNYRQRSTKACKKYERKDDAKENNNSRRGL